MTEQRPGKVLRKSIGTVVAAPSVLIAITTVLRRWTAAYVLVNVSGL